MGETFNLYNIGVFQVGSSGQANTKTVVATSFAKAEAAILKIYPEKVISSISVTQRDVLIG